MDLSQAVGRLSNPTAVAGLYSQLAGVLAGFALAGLFALIAAQQSNAATALVRSFVPLIAAFIGLVGSSLNYGILAGDDPSLPRAAALQVSGGVGFGAAGVMLFYSLLVLLYGVMRDLHVVTPPGPALTAARGAVSFIRIAMAVGVAPAVQFSVAGGVRDFANATSPSGAAAYGAADVIALVLTVAVTLWGIYRLWSTRGRAVPTAEVVTPGSLSGSTVALAVGSVVVTFGQLTFNAEGAAGWAGLPIVEMLLLAGFSSFAVFWATEHPAQ